MEYRKEVAGLLNKAFEIVNCDEGNTTEITIKKDTMKEICGLVNILQANYLIGIKSNNKDEPVYAINEDIKEEE